MKIKKKLTQKHITSVNYNEMNIKHHQRTEFSMGKNMISEKNA